MLPGTALAGCLVVICLLVAQGTLNTAHAQGQDAEHELAERYAPILYLKEQQAPCSTVGDVQDPAPVDIVLGNPESSLRHRSDAEVIRAPAASDLFRAGPMHYLEFPGNPRSPGCTYERDYLEAREGHPSVAYAAIRREPGQDGFALQYWFFYYFNDWTNNHEGDWEMVQILFPGMSPAEALRSAPDRVAYAQHGGAERASWSDPGLEKEDGRPVVYVSAGSHASYFSPGLYVGRGERGAGFGCDDSSGPHRRIEPEVRLLPGEVSEPRDTFAWLAFEGRWGQYLPGENNGPTGPNMKRPWHEPFTWDSEQRDRSLKAPGGDFSGPGGVSFFCDAAGFGGRLLLAFENRPLLVGVAMSIVGGIAAVAFASVGISVVRAPRRERWTYREARSLGQMLRAAADIYRSHWWRLLALSGVLVPLGLVLASLQSGLFAIPGLSTLVALVDARAFTAVIAIIYGYEASLVVALLVVSGVVALMAQIETGASPGIGRAYATVFRQTPALLHARGRSVVVIVLLLVSVIGAPFAFRAMVRWFFAEHEVLLQGTPANEALARSATLVDTSRWRTLGIVLFLGALGGLMAPVTSFVLVVLTPLPLWLVNVISFGVYSAVLPFVAVTLTFLYWDLVARFDRSAINSTR